MLLRAWRRSPAVARRPKESLGLWSCRTSVSPQLTCQFSSILYCHICMCMCLGKSTKVHLYYCMKNCAQSPTKLRESILNIVDHYQVSQKCIISFLCMSLHKQSFTKNKHTKCHEESACRRPGYRPTKLRLTSPTAIQAYEKALKATLIYRNAESYCRVSNNGFSFYNKQAHLPLVSRYFLDWVLQPSAAHLPSQTYSFWLHNLQDENESCLYGLGTLLIQLHLSSLEIPH